MFKIPLKKEIASIFNLVEKQNKEIYLVGKCVRDSILGRLPKKYEFITNASLEEIQEILKNDMKFKHKDTLLENEIVSIISYTEMKDTLKSIDFTINTLIFNPTTGLIDYFGGKEDLDNKIIRMNKSLSEEPENILKALYISSVLNYKLEENTKKEVIKNKEKLNNLSKDVITKYFKLILVGDNILSVLVEYEEIITTIIPELKPAVNFDQKSPYHPHDVYIHTCMVVAHTQPVLITRLAALLHDIGKPSTFTLEIKPDGREHGHFYGHGLESRVISVEVLKKCFTFSKAINYDVLTLVEFHDSGFIMTNKSLVRLFRKVNFDLNLLDSFLDLRYSDRLDHTYDPNAVFPDLNEAKDLIVQLVEGEHCVSIKNLCINGHDILDLGYTGPNVGFILLQLLLAVKNKTVENEKYALFEFIKTIKF